METFAEAADPLSGLTSPDVEQSVRDLEDSPSPEQESERALVKMWQDRIIRAKKKWEPDWDRMRRNMEFAYGLQWPGQSSLTTSRYINNIVQNIVKQKVASLYAKNPKVSAVARPRLNYQIWDESSEALQEAMATAQTLTAAGQPLPVELMAFLNDVDEGRKHIKMVERVGKTLEYLFSHAIDSQKPEFKSQLKQCVRRAVVCSVAFARPYFCRDSDPAYPSSVDTGGKPSHLTGRANVLLSKLSKGDAPPEGAEVGNLRSLSVSLQSDPNALPERLEFDFPPATSIILDERCRTLTDFVAARWLAQEYTLPVDEINAFFNVEVKVGGSQGEANEVKEPTPGEEETCHNARLWEVFDYDTKSHFFIVDGWKDFVQDPQPPPQSLTGFWHHFALVFNESEVEPDTKASIYPPSDVELVRSPQMEWNRTREALRDQRNANAPKYLARKGMLSDVDKEALRNAEPNSIVELESVPADQPLDKFVVPFQFVGIDPALYETLTLEQDLMLGGGMQQANIGPAQPNVTATVGTIAEQSRLNASSSNIDDLDGFLSRIAQAGGEILLQEMSIETVKRIAGPGAVWPTQPATRADFMAEIFLKVEAASSGRPNQAIDIANGKEILPLILQAGGNPVGVVKDLVRRLGDTLDPQDFFPLLPPTAPAQSGQEGGESKGPSKSKPGTPPEPQPQPSPPMAGANGSDGMRPS